MNKKFKRFFGFSLFSIFVFMIMFLFTITLSLAKAGFEDPEIAFRYNFYLISGIIGFVIITLGYIALIIFKKDDKYGESLAYYSIGESPSLKFFKRFTAPQLIFLSLIFFSSFFLIANVSKVFVKSLTGLTVLPQQFSKVDSLLFSTALIPASENLLAGAVIVISMIALIFIAIRTKMNITEFKWIARLGVPLIVGIFAVLWHYGVYPDSETALLVVFLFWYLGSFLAIITGFFAVFWIIHTDNNFFIDLGRFLSSESILFWIGAVIVLLIVIYGLFYRKRLFGRKSYNFEK